MAGPTPRRPDDPDLLQALRGIVGDDQVIVDTTTRATYRGDAGRRRSAPGVVVRPGDRDEVAAVVGLCVRSGVAWTARGAGTGYAGGALAGPGELLISLARMRRILAVDLADGIVVAEPGVTTLALARAVAPSHRLLPDLASAAVSTLGGNVALDAAGPRSAKHGGIGEHVVGLDVVLPDGSPVALRRDDPGYDLLGAVIGSEGTLGITVAVHLRVRPAPETVRTLVAHFPDLLAAANAAGAILAGGAVPAALELLDGLTVTALDRAGRGDLRPGAAAALLVELDGPREETVAELETVLARCAGAGALDLRVALDPVERDRLWESWSLSFVAMRRIAAGYEVLDVAVPRSRIVQVLTEIGALCGEFGLRAAHVLHAGEGTLHPMVCFDPADADQVDRAAALADRIARLCLAAEGSIAAEHGIGRAKSALLGEMYRPAELDGLRRLRRAFDPAGLANPGTLSPLRD